uniref:Uncharacterized protein n=1 Tax=Cucumis melo TaxID=3656 RepID=A0A9I9E410_CUCME
ENSTESSRRTPRDSYARRAVSTAVSRSRRPKPSQRHLRASENRS